MNSQEKRLTEAQSEFAEKHHHIVLDFLRRRLPMGEFYDVVVFRYMRTVQLYCTSTRLRRYKFETVANKAMDWAVKDYWRKLYKKSVPTVSLDKLVGSEKMQLHELAACDGSDVCEDVCDSVSADELLAALSGTQHKMLSLRLEGYKDSEIAAQCNSTVSDVASVFAQIRSTASAMGMGIA